MRSLLLLALVAIATAADMRPNEVLPWCRVTLNQAATLDTDEPKLKAVDGWYDAETRLLFPAHAFTKDDTFATTPLPAERIVRVQVGTHSPTPMPAQCRGAVNAERRRGGAARAAVATRE